MRYLSLFLILVPVTTFAGYPSNSRCFVCKPAVSKIYQRAIVRKPQVINRFVGLQPPEEAKIDVEGIIARARALEMALQAIPGVNQNLEDPRWK